MERMIDKLARQLNSYDEASLLQLWQRYALKVREFEPSREWEEATLALSFIQAVRWKNQLFNYRLSESQPASGHDDFDSAPYMPRFGSKKRDPDTLDEAIQKTGKATILSFPEKRKPPSPDGPSENGE